MLREELDYVVPLGIPYSQFLAWSDSDRGYALAWSRNKRVTCSGCGTRADEWEADEDAYYSDSLTCEGCARLTEERESNLRKGPDGNVLPGQHVYLRPDPPPPPTAEQSTPSMTRA